MSACQRIAENDRIITDFQTDRLLEKILQPTNLNNAYSDNCIIYGHNINGRRMFGALHAYSSESYYREHPEISFRAGDEKRKYQIVSVMQTTTSSPIYSFTDVGNWDKYGEYVNQILSGSLYQTEMGDQIRA